MSALRRFALLGFLAAAVPTAAEEPRVASFKDAKTFFQTNSVYREQIDIPVDAVVIHPHYTDGTGLGKQFTTWQRLGVPIGRMFFADSDEANRYWTGKFDGIDHTQDCEIDAAGNIIKCAGVRPYMNPTAGWIGYLKHRVDRSLDAGVDAILPEEPLAHLRSGYEESFKELWKEHYGFDWQPQNSSPYAHYLTGQLKSRLYWNLEKELLDHVRRSPQAQTRHIDFVVPIHSLHSNVAAGLTAPLGTSRSLDGIDGYIGQIWTGPVRWALANYGSEEKSFFCSAYALYDYFRQLTVETDKKLWLLVDPVEDDPNHTWEEFTQWYKTCTVAMLFMEDVDSYEVMPWPARIFLPGFGTGGGTPAPEEFRRLVLSITQALQEMPRGGEWIAECASGAIGVAVADSAMWQPQERPVLQTLYGPILPLLRRGIPVSSFVLERAADVKYAARFRVLVVSFKGFKPYEERMCDALAEWTARGGHLIILGGGDDSLAKDDAFWWRKAGYDTPTQALLAKLRRPADAAEWTYEGGSVHYADHLTPDACAETARAANEYLPLVAAALERAGIDEWKLPGYFCMRRGDYVIAQAETKPLCIEGRFLDVFSPDLAIRDGIDLAPGESGLYKDVSRHAAEGSAPRVLHATYRLRSQEADAQGLRFTIRGPKDTALAARIFTGGRRATKITATSAGGEAVAAQSTAEGECVLVECPNDVEGVRIHVGP